MLPEVWGKVNGVARFTTLNRCTSPAIKLGSTIEVPSFQQLDFRIPQAVGHGILMIPGAAFLISTPNPPDCSLVIVERHPLYGAEVKLEGIRISDLSPHGAEPRILDTPGPFHRERWTQTTVLNGITFRNTNEAREILKSSQGEELIAKSGISASSEDSRNLIMLLLNNCVEFKTPQRKPRKTVLR